MIVWEMTGLSYGRGPETGSYLRIEARRLDDLPGEGPGAVRYGSVSWRAVDAADKAIRARYGNTLFDLFGKQQGVVTHLFTCAIAGTFIREYELLKEQSCGRYECRGNRRPGRDYCSTMCWYRVRRVIDTTRRSVRDEPAVIEGESRLALSALGDVQECSLRSLKFEIIVGCQPNY